MPGYAVPPRFDPGELRGVIDPNRGFLCMLTYWQPDPDAPDPEMPGRKLSMTAYIPVRRGEPCLCGSGKRYRQCCRREPLWQSICPNPGGRGAGYSLIRPQSARFEGVDGVKILGRLGSERRLRCVDASPRSSFWVWHGDRMVKEEYGILCFGDIELRRRRTLLVTAMSDLRMEMLLAVLQEIAGDLLGEPRLTYDKMPVIDKRTGKTRTQRPVRSPAPRKDKAQVTLTEKVKETVQRIRARVVREKAG
jgi:hypothetical protein